ncbi:MAG: hypothetical protein QG656_2697 [Candidatus Hydrogenedentes bacterium]|nr:hypothetical protein [Candidatus Hydrogenedentota bacterium]
MGAGQLQFNVTTAERLRKAQKESERYGNIPVRVAGYSQMFKLLTKDLQEHVFTRTKHVWWTRLIVERERRRASFG